MERGWAVPSHNLSVMERTESIILTYLDIISNISISSSQMSYRPLFLTTSETLIGALPAPNSVGSTIALTHPHHYSFTLSPNLDP